MKTIESINGISVSIDDEGKGMPAFLVHGLSSSKEGMYPVRDMIKGQYRALCYDTRGHGESQKMPGYTLQDHADDLIALAKKYGEGKKVNLIGFSMGSYICTAAAIKVPELVDHLILIGTKGEGSTSSVERILAERGLRAEDVSEIKKLMLLMGATFAPKGKLGHMLKMMKFRSPVKLSDSDKAAETKALHNFDLFPGMPSISAKTLVIAGEFDGINPPEYGKKVADAIPDARYELLSGVGHVMMFEDPEKLKKLILDFLAE